MKHTKQLDFFDEEIIQEDYDRRKKSMLRYVTKNFTYKKFLSNQALQIDRLRDVFFALTIEQNYLGEYKERKIFQNI